MKLIVEIDDLPKDNSSITVKIFSFGVHVKGKKRQKIVTVFDAHGLSVFEASRKIKKAAWSAVNYVAKVKKVNFSGEKRVFLFESAEGYLLSRTQVHGFDEKKMFTSARNYLLEKKS